MRKRIVSLLMTILIIATMLPVQALAAELASSRAAEDEIVLEEEAVIPPEEKAPEEQAPQEADAVPAEQSGSTAAESDDTTTDTGETTIVTSGYWGVGLSITWTLDSNGLMTISGEGAMTQASADISWADIQAQVKTIIIESGVTSIGVRAFEGFTNVTSVIIPDTVTCIEAYAFYRCASISGTLNIPSSVVTIGDYAFARCKGLSGPLTIPASVVTIGKNAFDGCIGLTGPLFIPANVTSIGDYAFSECSGFSGLVISEGVNSIGKYAFDRCKGFTGDLIIPNSITNIGKLAFSDCTGFDGSLIIGNGLKTIPAYCFDGCTGLSGDLIIPDNIERIEGRAFYLCSGFDGTLNLGKGVTYIGGGAFLGCTSLHGDLIIPDNVKTIDTFYVYKQGDVGAFENCTGFDGTLYLGKSLETIKSAAFSGCSNLHGDLVLPDRLTSIKDGYDSDRAVFYGCDGFDGSLVIGKGITNVDFYIPTGFTGDLIIKNVETVSDKNVFANISFTGDLVLGDDLRSINFKLPNTFTGKLKLGSHIEEIPAAAFSNAQFTGDLNIPNSVTTIGNGAFWGCSGFTGDLKIPDNVKNIGGNAFRNCIGFNGKLALPKELEIIEDYTFAECNGLAGNLIIPDGVVEIGEYAFYNCAGFDKGLQLSDSITTIGGGAFSGCRKLSGSLSFGDNIEVIGRGAFFNCRNLTGDIIIPNSVTSVGASAFSSCSGFNGHLSLSDSMTSIQNRTFEHCSGLLSATIPESITSIDSYAFYGCNNLKNIYYSGSEEDWANLISKGHQLSSATIHYNSTAPKLASLSFSSATYGVSPGQPLQIRLHLKAVDKDCEDLVRLLTFTSSNNTVFDIDSDNISYEIYGDTTADIVITATPTVSSGSATIMAMLSDGTSAFCEVIVVGQDTTVTLRKDLYAIKVDDTGTLYMTASNGELLPELQWKWTSSDESIVSIKAGDGSYQASGDGIPAALISAQCTFIAKKRGNATITCTLSNGATAVCRITVYNAEDDAETIKSNEYNAAQYNESDFTYAVKQIGKLRDDWEKKYKKYISAVDGVLKPLDNEADILTALQSKENAARQIRQADEAASKKSNMMLTFAAGFPEEWKDGAYEILCDIFESRVDNKVSFSSIDLSKEISASAAIVNEVCSGMWNESGTKTYMYAKNKAVFVRYSCMGLLTEGFGYMTFSRGHQSYTVSICSNMESAKNCMAIYLNACKALGQKAVQNARKATIKDMLALIGANELTEPVFKAQITKGLKAYNAYLEEVGLAELSDSLTEIYSYYDSIKRIVGAIKGMNPESLAANKKTLQKELDNLMNPDFGTSEATKVSKALAELKIASQKLYNALDEFVAKGCLSKESGLEWPFSKKTQVKCPVDVEIYRGDTLIGYVGETESWYDDSIYVEENDDAKIIYSSAGDELSIKLTGTDYGSLSITVEEFSNGSPVERLNYYDIDLQEGKNISFTVPAQTIGEVKDTLTVLDGEVQIPASEYISADTDAAVYIDVDISDDAAGTVSGDGVYVRGDAVVLKASAVSGYLFAGWYDEDGHLVSASSSYEFSASVDCSFLAKYVRITLLGDVNGDGIIDVYDLQSLYECCCDIGSLTGNPFPCADVNQDTKISILDVQMLYAYLTTGNWTYPQT